MVLDHLIPAGTWMDMGLLGAEQLLEPAGELMALEVGIRRS